MTGFRKRRWAWALALVAATYLLGVYVIPGLIDRSDGQAPHGSYNRAHHPGRCIERRQVPLEDGQHDGQSWRVTAGIENNHDCGAWLLKMQFYPQGATPGSWEGGWGIPAGGHLPDSATISAQDESTGEDRVISGVTGWRVRTVVFSTRSGMRFVVHPKAPEAELRQRFGWLRNLRYFLRFYPVGDPVKEAKLLDSRGRTIATFDCRLGEIEGNMTLPL